MANKRDDSARQSPAEPTALAEPVEISKFWKSSRSKQHAVIVAFREYQGHELIDCRVHFVDAEGKLKPTNKGLSLQVAKLPELQAALTKAMAKARELGLLVEDGAK